MCARPQKRVPKVGWDMTNAVPGTLIKCFFLKNEEVLFKKDKTGKTYQCVPYTWEWIRDDHIDWNIAGITGTSDTFRVISREEAAEFIQSRGGDVQKLLRE